MEGTIMHEQLAMNAQEPVIARYYNYDHFSFPWHFHSEYEIIYVKDGHGERFVADSAERFRPGDVFLMGSNVRHFLRSDETYYGGDPHLRVRGVVIQFMRDFMEHAIRDYTGLAHVKSLLEQSERGFYFPPPQNGEIIRRIEALPRRSGLYRITGLLLLLDCMATFSGKRFMSSPHPDINMPEHPGSRIDKILSYLNRHYTENVSLNDVSSRFSMNASAFCRYFRQHTGKSCTGYLQDLRIGYACKLLAGTSYDISRIGMECGYNTTCHFNKIFKRKTSLTPSEYRNKFIR